MMNQEKYTGIIDIRGDYVLKKDNLLELLLHDKTLKYFVGYGCL